MLELEKVVQRFILFSDLSEGAAERWKSFCQSAAAGIEARLRPEADTSNPDNLELLHIAAAALAYCDYLMVSSAVGSSDEVRVGDISLKSGATAASSDKKDAREMRDYFLGQAFHLLLPQCPALFATGGKE